LGHGMRLKIKEEEEGGDETADKVDTKKRDISKTIEDGGE